MIEVEVKTELGSYKKKQNHGHEVKSWIDCISAYEYPEEQAYDNGKEWSNCPCCGLKPKVWAFDNGLSTACGCGDTKYDHFSVYAESIMSVHSRCGGNVGEYKSDQLRTNWNEYCATMINPCSNCDLRIIGKW